MKHAPPRLFRRNQVVDPLDPTFWPDDPEPDHAWVCLSNRVCIHALIDRVDLEWARQWLWCHTYGSGSRIGAEGALYQISYGHIYARRSTTVRDPDGRRRGVNIWLHREILLRAEGPPPSELHMGDHLNGKTLDCRRKNLRWATPRENSINQFGHEWAERYPGEDPCPPMWSL